VQKGGETATVCPHDLVYPGVKNEDHKFWAQGKAVSGALRDAGYRLHLKDDRPPNSDTALMTVVRFTNLKADIPSTPANIARKSRNGGGAVNNSPVPRHTLVLAGGKANSKDYDHAYTANIPVVLIEGSITAGDRIKLSVKIEPAAAEPFVLWS